MKAKNLFIDWIKTSIFVVSVLSLSSCDEVDGQFFLLWLLLCSPLFIGLFFIIRHLAKQKQGEKTNTEHKAVEMKVFEREKTHIDHKAVEMEVLEREKATQAKLNDPSYDITNHPLLISFKKKHNKDFVSFCKNLNNYQTDGIPAETEEEEKREIYFSSDYFVIVKDDFWNFKQLVNNHKNMKEELLYRNISLDKFEVLNFDNILYIETITVKGKKTTYRSKEPSNLSLAITEELFGVAAANRAANPTTYTFDTPDYIKYKLVFSGSSNSRPIFIRKTDINTTVRNTIFENLLVKKQKDEYLAKNNSSNTVTQTNNLDELKKLKELLDAGIITQEEFDAKKKQILGL